MKSHVFQSKAARDVGEAALDQTEAELLESEAKSLNADVAESTATAGAGRPWWNEEPFSLSADWEILWDSMEILWKSCGNL